MGLVQRSTLALRFIGDDLEPQSISAALGASPTLAYSRGALWATKRGKQMVGRTGVWSLSVPDRAPADLDGQIEELIAPLCLDLSIWRDLSSRYGGNLFAGLFMTTHNGLEATEYFNEGLAIEPKALSLVGSRGLRLDLDIYAGSAVANREEFQTR